MARWTVYTRPGCTLCEVFLQELAELLGSARAAHVRLVDISDDSALMARYGTKIPVLTVDDEFICCYRIDPVRIQAQLDV